MAMKIGGSRRGGPSADINMTPMIDIMLVLLIIFMVVQVGLQRGLALQVPPETSPSTEAPPDQIVLEVDAGATFHLNSEPVTGPELAGRLREVFAPRPRKVLFVKGSEDATYGNVIFAVDAARGAGVEVVGLVPRR